MDVAVLWGLIDRFGLAGLFAAGFAWLLKYHLDYARITRAEYADLLRDNIQEWSNLRTLIEHLLRTHGSGQ